MSSLLKVTEELQMINEGNIMNNDALLDIRSTLGSINTNLEDLYLFLLEESDTSLEDKRESQRQNEQLLNSLKNNQSGSGLDQMKESAKDSKSAGGALGYLGAGIAGVGRALASVGAASKLVISGSVALGTAIGSIGAGIAGAAWLTGKAFPTFVDGISKFENIDGPALESAGKGVRELGFGIAAWGVGEISRGVGNIVGSVSELFGQQDTNGDIIDQLERFGNADINTENVKNNAEALRSFGLAMAYSGVGQTAKGIGSFVNGVVGGIGELFGGEDPLTQLQEFGSIKVNRENIENNAAAMTAFGRSIAVGGAGITAGGIGTFVSGVLGGIGEAFGGEQSDPLSQLKLFGETRVNKDNVENNAEAMTAFSRAISLGGAGIAAGGIGTFVSGVLGGIGEAFGGEQSDPLSQLKLFGETRVNKDNIQNNAEAMEAFGKAMTIGGAGNISEGIGSFVSGVLGGIGKFFGGDDPLEQLKTFGETEINTTNVKKNAKALRDFSNSLSGIKDVNSVKALKTLAKNMSVAVPLIDSLSNGGEYNPPGFLNFKVDFGEGILNPDLQLKDVAKKVQLARDVFAQNTTDSGIEPLNSSGSTRTTTQLERAAAEKNEIEAAQSSGRMPSGNNGGGNVNVSNNVQNNRQSIIRNRPPASSEPDNASDTQITVWGP